VGRQQQDQDVQRNTENPKPFIREKESHAFNLPCKNEMKIQKLSFEELIQFTD